MSSWGTTTITALGPAAKRAQLATDLAATAHDSLSFSLAQLAPEVWVHDGLVSKAEVDETPDSLQLTVCMVHDADCIQLAASLSRRHPALRFRAAFQCEGTWPSFTMASYAGGAELYLAIFDGRFGAWVSVDEPGTRDVWYLPLFERSRERDLAADDQLDRDAMRLLLERPVCAGIWRQSDNGPNSPVFLREGEEGDGLLVLVMEPGCRTGTVLHGVNRAGGYDREEMLGGVLIRERFPELVPELDRLLQAGTEAEAARETVAPLLDEDEIVF